MKKKFVILFMFIALMNCYSQNYSCKPYFYIPNSFVETGEDFGNKLIVENLSATVNSSNLEYAPVVSLDGKKLYFISDRTGSKKLDNSGSPFDRNSHDFWYSNIDNYNKIEFSEPINLDTFTNSFINTYSNEGAAAFSSDGKKIYFTKCNTDDGPNGCDIYVSEIINGKWSKPKNLGFEVNSTYWDVQPTISADNKTLYFISNRPVGGENNNLNPDNNKNMNIWYSVYDEKWGMWSEAKPLIGVNTTGKENCPFIAADNKTLFFSSDGIEPNYGGLDFYVTRFDPQTYKWSKPVNLGAKINSEKDEMFISIPAGGDVIYFSSYRKDLPNYQGTLDLYIAKLPEMKSIPESLNKADANNTILTDSLEESVNLDDTEIKDYKIYSEYPQCIDLNLLNIYPNPFSTQVTIEFENTNPDEVEILIFDVTGNLIKNINKGTFDAGSHSLIWNGLDNSGMQVSSGAYYITLILGKNNNYYSERKCVVLNK